MALDWFTGWAKRHIDRHRRGDWPLPTSEFWVDLHGQFEGAGVSESAAEDASKALGFCFPKYLTGDKGHHVTLMACVRRIWASSEVPNDNHPISRWRAETAAQVRRDAELDAVWESLPESERSAIEARILASRPYLKRRGPLLLRSFCLAALEESHFPTERTA